MSEPVFGHGLVVGKFAPLHRGHQWLLDQASAQSRDLTVVVWSNPDFPAMSNAVRAAWVHALYPAARVIVGADGPPNDAPELESREYTRRLLDQHGIRPDAVFSSEKYGPALAAHLGARHVEVDAARRHVPISGTTIRADVHAHRHALDSRVYAHFVERVVFMGAESTGKSTLAARMAQECGTAFVAEYGREYYAERSGVLTLDDYVTIAQHHRELEDAAALTANRYLFVDTNAITTMFFSHYYNRDSLPSLRALADACANRYHHVVVCDDDIPFEQDGWRDNVVWRGRMQGMVLHDLAVRQIPCHVVSGPVERRVQEVMALLAGARLQNTEL